MNINTVKKSMPIFKLCYAKNQLVKMIDCNCIHKCDMEYVIPHHQSTPLKFFTSLKCEMTDFNQKIGNCNCTDICSASMNDLQSYEFTSLNVNNPN
jgi:hypothetical protein